MTNYTTEDLLNIISDAIKVSEKNTSNLISLRNDVKTHSTDLYCNKAIKKIKANISSDYKDIKRAYDSVTITMSILKLKKEGII